MWWICRYRRGGSADTGVVDLPIPAWWICRQVFGYSAAPEDIIAQTSWTLYWRGTALMRQRINAELDAVEHGTRPQRTRSSGPRPSPNGTVSCWTSSQAAKPKTASTGPQ